MKYDEMYIMLWNMMKCRECCEIWWNVENDVNNNDEMYIMLWNMMEYT